MKNILSLSILALFASPAFAGLDLSCDFTAGRVFNDTGYTITAMTSATRYTDFTGEVVVLLADDQGNSVEQRSRASGRLREGDSTVLIRGAIPGRAASCSAYFVGQQRDVNDRE